MRWEWENKVSLQRLLQKLKDADSSVVVLTKAEAKFVYDLYEGHRQMEPCDDIKDALHIAQTDRDKWKNRAKKLAKIIGISDCDIDHYNQEHYVDCIRRQQALQTFGLSDKTRKYGGDHSGYNTIMLYDVQIALEELPSVQPEQKIDMVGHYKVITLCGSTRFKDIFLEIAKELTLQGYIVLMPMVFGHAGDTFTDDQKEMLDNMHKRKINMSDEIYVINKDGYIGNSTKSEIRYAQMQGKPVKYMEE